MRRALLLAGLLLVAGCGQPSPTMNALEREMQLARATARVRRSMDPCLIGKGAMEPPRPLRDCLPLQPQERMQGVWYSGFEETSFVADATGVPARRIITRASVEAEARHYVELIVPPAEVDRIPGDFRSVPGTRAVLISFLGRRAPPERSADGRAMNQVIVVDRLLSVRVLGGATETFIDCRDFPRRDPHGLPCAPGTE